eukprot:TRINITY_DN1888_c1_g1_i2.p1 TRINITY_DN1888_c1_g1~~TRINITY_DN1888_c1_g1_i2.p1  ORF type:complete len:527 (+),score=128.95 TRINITY_DN1888_c1_g1_i2:507-2087(+)
MASSLPRRPPASGQQAIAGNSEDGAGTRCRPEAVQSKVAESTPRQAGQATATPVRDRIQMFENKSTPGLRPPSVHVPGTSSASRIYGANTSVSRGAQGSASALQSASGVVDGGSLFTPIQKIPQLNSISSVAAAVQPKELFRSSSDNPRSAKAPYPSHAAKTSRPGGTSSTPQSSSVPNLSSTPSSFIQAGMRGLDGEKLDNSRLNTSTDAFDRLAAGGKRDDVAKPKSLRAAEQAKIQEEKKLRERQERDQERDRQRAAAAAAQQASATTGASSGLTPSASNKDLSSSSAQQSARGPPGGKPGAGATAKKALRRSACGVAAPLEAIAAAAAAAAAAETATAKASSSTGFESSRSALTSATAQASQSSSASGGSARKPMPPVPAFRDPYYELRQIDLPPKNAEDNYEISEYGGDSDNEDPGERERMRASKHVPKWAESYLDALSSQADMDPDTVFGSRVPHCNMEEIFTESLYKQVGKNRPKRQRGSSGDWRKDRLTRTEIRDYKNRMGHKRSWDEKQIAGPGPKK